MNRMVNTKKNPVVKNTVKKVSKLKSVKKPQGKIPHGNAVKSKTSKH